MKTRDAGVFFFLLALGALAMPAGAGIPTSPTSPPPSPSFSPSPSPTPIYHAIDFGSQKLAQSPSCPIEVFEGFAGVRLDSRGAAVCVSFKDTGAVPATRILFAFPLLDASGDTVATLPLDRRGKFSPGIGIYTWKTLSDMEEGNGPHAYGDNCARIERGVSALQLLETRRATYQIKRVEFADGTVWPKP